MLRAENRAALNESQIMLLAQGLAEELLVLLAFFCRSVSCFTQTGADQSQIYICLRFGTDLPGSEW